MTLSLCEASQCFSFIFDVKELFNGMYVVRLWSAEMHQISFLKLKSSRFLYLEPSIHDRMLHYRLSSSTYKGRGHVLTHFKSFFSKNIF